MLNFAARQALVNPKKHHMTYWLMKSEPDAYSIDDLERDGREMWDGIRNYQARNTMRDEMKIGDGVFFYHSSCKVPGIVGIAKVASQPYSDPTQFDKNQSTTIRKAIKTIPAGASSISNSCARPGELSRWPKSRRRKVSTA